MIPLFQERIDLGECKGDLFLKHYSFVIDYILRKYPGKRIMLWDDMLRSAPMDVLNRFEYGLIRDHVELVVWQYSEKPYQHLPTDLLARYRSIFRQGLWAATAFKGATSSCALIPGVGVHVANHLGKMHVPSFLDSDKREKNRIFQDGWRCSVVKKTKTLACMALS